MTATSSAARRRVLVAHNAYRMRGGEDAVAESEIALLRGHGHEVVEYLRHNDELHSAGRLRLAAETLWSRRSTHELGELFRAFKPEIVHVHNTLPLISPSIYWAADEEGIPVVQTLHNFRLLCPQAMLLREGRVCESCVGRTPWPGVVHACYRGSRAQTGVLAGMLVLHRALGTWSRKIDRYIALNAFCRARFVAGGLPAERIAIKPNFVDLPLPPEAGRRGLLFVGRLSSEKGTAVLARAAAALPPAALRIVGTGPEGEDLAAVPAATCLGARIPSEVAAEMRAAIALVMPSICYENFPRTLVEAYACGLPVIASRLGALGELVRDGTTGLLFEPGDAADLAAKMQWALAHPARMAEMGSAARRLYEREYTADTNYRQLMAIYDEAAIARAQR